MDVRIHESAEQFRDIAEPLYRRDPVGNTIELTLLQAGEFGDDALLLTVWDDDVPVGAALHTPPYPLACNGLPNDVHPTVAIDLVRIRPDISGVRGRLDLAMDFANAWSSVTGCAGTLAMSEMLYRLGTLRPPVGVPGAHREATRTDRALLVDWVGRFFVETFSHHRDDTAGERFVDNAEAVGDRFILWEDGGAPVSIALLRAPGAGVSRVGPVFTPRDLRGRGYGSAVTAAAASLARLGGVDDVVLFADLANPTSNAIYQRIGFEAVAESVRIDFSSP
ncbi:MAG TPA: GNAT family N-acetyltransferase [Mycobacterium sp.]|nr:GNAT family N-acetyltransferase [Mycobacterium sp.]